MPAVPLSLRFAYPWPKAVSVAVSALLSSGLLSAAEVIEPQLPTELLELRLERVADNGTLTALSRARLGGERLSELELLFEQQRAGGLRSEQLERLVVEDAEIIESEVILDGEIGRIRDVRQGPDGAIYLLTDHSSGGLYRLRPTE